MGFSSSNNSQRYNVFYILKLSLKNIGFSDFEKRYPNSRKTCFYKKTRVEKYAPYSMKDGIVLKVAEFADYDCKFISLIK